MILQYFGCSQRHLLGILKMLEDVCDYEQKWGVSLVEDTAQSSRDEWPGLGFSGIALCPVFPALMLACEEVWRSSSDSF